LWEWGEGGGEGDRIFDIVGEKKESSMAEGKKGTMGLAFWGNYDGRENRKTTE